jgi:hypothetical protein
VGLAVVVVAVGALSRCSTLDANTDRTQPAIAVAAALDGKTSGSPAAIQMPGIIELDPAARFRPSAIFSVAATSTAFRLRELHSGRRLVAAAIEAANSDDPVLWANAARMTLPCNYEQAFMRGKDIHALHVEGFAKGNPGKVPSPEELTQLETDVRRQQQRVYAPPGYLYPPEPVRSKVNAVMARGTTDFEAALTARDENAEDKLFAELRLKMTLIEQTSSDAVRDAVAVQCPGMGFSDDLSRALRTARERGRLRGDLGVQLLDARGKSKDWSLTALNDYDYALLKRIIDERSPSGLAQLLLGPANSGLDTSDPRGLPADAHGPLAMAGYWVPQLVACDFGLADCSADSPWFKTTCMENGGCQASDFGAMLRYIMQRDGLDPTYFDRQAQRVRDAIYGGNLDALGIRRKQ